MGLILASGSPQRRKLLKRLRTPFRVIPSRVSERSSEKDPRKLVKLLAKRKALAVARAHPDDVVLGADTLVVCAGRILGKPKNEKDALRILKLLNGRWQRVCTGVAVAAQGRVVVDCEVSRVKARRLDERTLRVFARKHLDKAGAYAVQDREDPFIERVDGALDNVVGLPVDLTRRLLKLAKQRL